MGRGRLPLSHQVGQLPRMLHDRFLPGQLLDPQARDRSRDHQLLDLLGAFEDVVDLGEGVPGHPDSALDQRGLCPLLPCFHRLRPARLGMN